MRRDAHDGILSAPTAYSGIQVLNQKKRVEQTAANTGKKRKPGGIGLRSLRRGFVHIYTGDGKGKTTAALGLALRASGAGLRVYFAQFMKKGRFSEITALESLPNATIEQFGRPAFVRGVPAEEDRRSARWGLAAVAAALTGGTYDLVVADELCTAIAARVVTLESVLKLLPLRPPRVELVLTGRGAPPRLIRAADLVTEMRMRKHYFAGGVRARKGIEY